MKKFRPGLHLLADLGATSVDDLEHVIRSGHFSCLRYRSGSSEPALQDEATKKALALCKSADIPFLVVNDLELAIRVGAQGIHLHTSRHDLVSVRNALGEDSSIGITVSNIREAEQAVARGVDYLYWLDQPLASQCPSPTDVLSENFTRIKASRAVPLVVPCLYDRHSVTDLLQLGADALLFSLEALPSSLPALDLEEFALLFNRCKAYPRGSVLTVAGSDSGGGAGIQGDLKTITLLGGYALSAISCLTAQNTLGVQSTYQPPTGFFSEQLHAVLRDIPVDVIKTGMLHSAEIIESLAETLDHFQRRILIIDPVMTAKGGWDLLEEKAQAALVNLLLPRSYLVTPNIPEAEKLTGIAIDGEQGMIDAAFALKKLGARNVLIKGGHLEGKTSTDILLEGTTIHRFTVQRIHNNNTHGTGCTYASAIATLLAQGEALPMAVSRAKEFVTAAILHARPLGSGHGPLNHFLAAKIFSGDVEERPFCRTCNGYLPENSLRRQERRVVEHISGAGKISGMFPFRWAE